MRSREHGQQYHALHPATPVFSARCAQSTWERSVSAQFGRFMALSASMRFNSWFLRFDGKGFWALAAVE